MRIRGALSNIIIDRKTWIGLATCLCFVAAVYNENVPIAAAAAVLFLVSILVCGRDLSIRISGYHIYILLFAGYIYLSSLWATDSSLTIPKGNAVFLIFIFMTLVSIANSDECAQERLMKCLMYGGYLVAAVYVARNGISGMTAAVDEMGRVSSEVLNANTLGMITAYAVLINLYYIFCINKKLKVLDLLVLPALLVIFLTSSRKALLIIALGILGILLINNYKRRRRDITLVKWLILIVIAAGAVLILTQLPAFSGLMKRLGDVFEAFSGGGTRGENSAWLRARYIELGGQLFLENPVGGVGIGNSNHYTMAMYGKDHYLHCNYAELLGCGGIIGFALYYSIYVYMIAVMIKYRKYRTKEYGLVFMLMLIILVMDIGVVRYFSKSSYFYLMFLWLETEKLKKNAKEAAYEKLSICSKAAA